MVRASRLLTTLTTLLLVPLAPLVVTASEGSASGAETPVATAPVVATVAPVAAARAGRDQWPGDRFRRRAVDAAHPYSPPVYYPLRQYMRMDCYRSNPGCPAPRPVWTMSLSITDQTRRGDAILAMGAGKLRFVRRGVPCGSGTASFGTTVEIDHGGGVVSRYGHLSNADLAKYRAMSGELVAAGDRIGTMGTTGAGRCATPYVNFQVEKNDRLVEFERLRACTDGSAQAWPRAQFQRYPTWNDVREDDSINKTRVRAHDWSFFPRMRRGERPSTLRAANAPDQSCLPSRTPVSPSRPVAPSVKRAGSGRVLVSWSGMPSRVVPQVRVIRQHPSRPGWKLVTTAAPARAGQQGVYVRGLRNGVEHRFLLSYRYAGSGSWSRTSPATDRVVGTRPAEPAYRGSRVGGGGTTLRMLWYRSKTHGFAVRSYEVAIRPRSATRWSTKLLPPGRVSHLFQDLRRGTAYTVRVRARSAAGSSGWTTRNLTPR